MVTLSASEKHAKLQQERTFLTSLLEAALHGNFATVERYVEDYSLRQSVPKETVVLQFRDGQGRTMLHFACQSAMSSNKSSGGGSGDKDIVEELLQGDWLPKTCTSRLLRVADNEGLTPLMLAAQLADRILSERRVGILLQTAAAANDKSACEYALATSKSGATALHYAASAAATSATIHALCDLAPAAISTYSQQGGTPLHWACAAASGSKSNDDDDSNISETIAALLDCGADWNACNTTTFPPLAYALATNHASRAKYLLQQARDRRIDASATLHYELPGQTTVYHMAADLNMVGVLAILLEMLPDAGILERRNARGLTARELAAMEGHVGCVLLLLPQDQQTEDEALAFIQKVKLQYMSISDSPDESRNMPALTQPQTGPPNEVETEAQQEALRVAGMTVTDEAKQNAATFKTEGNGHFAKKEFQQAVDCYTHAIDADPTDATFYSNRSAGYIFLQDPTNALRDAVICRYLKPDWPKGAYRMAIARLELGRYEDAAVSAWEGLQKDQDNDELKSLLQKCVKLGRKQHHGAKA